jgi:hypothetical protein
MRQSTIIDGNINIPLSMMDKTTKQINKETEDQNKTIKQTSLEYSTQ